MINNQNRFLLFILGLFFYGCISPNEQIRHEDIFTYVKKYADAMIIEGRDKYGSEHTPLFAAVLNRKTMHISTRRGFRKIEGVRDHDRSVGGSNPLEEIGLYKLLFELTNLTGDTVYRDEAEKALTFFFSNCQSKETGLLAWGEHLFWSFENEDVGHVMDIDYHEADAWGLWDECYALAPKACFDFAMGEWNHQVADHSHGDFSRHAKWSVHGPGLGMDFPRYAGQMIKRWAIAYQYSDGSDWQSREELIRATGIMVRRMEENMVTTGIRFLPAVRGADYIWNESNLELARCLMEAISCLQETKGIHTSLIDSMSKLALQQDLNFLSYEHLLNDDMGFAVTIDADTGHPRSRSTNRPFTVAWESGYGFHSHASVANLCFERYKQLHHSQKEIAEKYKSLLLKTADYYLYSTPDRKVQLKPSVFADVIELLLNSHYLTNDIGYLEKAEFFGWMAVDLFLSDGLPLPKASDKHNHYETITGGADLMYALLLLSQQIDSKRNI